MRKAIFAGLTALAFGADCARDMPVYSPEREVVQETPEIGGTYREVWSDAEKLKLSFYTESADGRRDLDYSWTRFEPRDSTECLKEEVVAKEYGVIPEQGIAGWLYLSLVIDRCQGPVESCAATYIPNNGMPMDVSADICTTPDEDFAAIKADTNENVDEQVRLWHQGKGFEE